MFPMWSQVMCLQMSVRFVDWKVQYGSEQVMVSGSESVAGGGVSVMVCGEFSWLDEFVLEMLGIVEAIISGLIVPWL